MVYCKSLFLVYKTLFSNIFHVKKFIPIERTKVFQCVSFVKFEYIISRYKAF